MSSPKTISGQSQNDFGTTGAAVVPLSRISLDTGLRDNASPSVSEPVRILLSEAASQHLEATGEHCFMIASKARHPEQPGRYVLHLVPCPLATARQAEGVLLGTHRATRIKPAKP